MQLKLPVDVHLAVGDDGKMMLLIGGLIKPVKPDELRDVLREKPLKRKRSSEEPREPKLTANGKTIGRPRKAKGPIPSSADARKRRAAKGLCSWCDNKPVKGKKICADHLVGARKAAEKARLSKKKAA